MQTPTGNTAGQPVLIHFSDKLISISQSGPGKITIFFDDVLQQAKYEARDHVLQKVNFKTILAALKGTHANILSVSMNQEGNEYKITVEVTYQFLPTISESFILLRRNLTVQESEQATIMSMHSHLKHVRDTIASLSNMKAVSGNIDSNSENFELTSQIPFQKTVYTLSLNIVMPSLNYVKAQMYYLNSITKQKKNANAVPQEGFFISHVNDAVSFELRFFAEIEDFDSVMFVMQGRWEGDYTLTMQNVESV